MTITDGFMIGAVILGPILAVQAQKWIETWKQTKERKLSVFKTLMATRGTPVSPRHVEALNLIDLEFSEKTPKEKAVLEAWKIYHGHLFDVPRNYQDPSYQSKMDVWGAKTNDLLIDLLHAMSQALGYSFGKAQLKKGAYTPQAHADIETELFLLRRGILDALYGKRPLPVIAFSPPPISQELVNPLTATLKDILKK
jgi:hypothetical protein